MLKAIEMIRGARSFVRMVNDPNRLEEVFKLSDRTSQKKVLEDIAHQFAQTERGAQALAACRRLPKLNIQELALLPEGTLGRVFADHMISNKLDPAAIPTLNAKEPTEFVRAHLYETHDIWHVAVGFGTDVAGELGLQAFYAAQFRGPLPMVILAAGMLNTAFYALADCDARMRAIASGYVAGKKAQALFGINWDEYWQMPIEKVRTQFGIYPQGMETPFAATVDL